MLNIRLTPHGRTQEGFLVELKAEEERNRGGPMRPTSTKKKMRTKTMVPKRMNGPRKSGLRKKKAMTKCLMSLKKQQLMLKLTLREQRSNELKLRKLEVSSRKVSHQKIETKAPILSKLSSRAQNAVD